MYNDGKAHSRDLIISRDPGAATLVHGAAMGANDAHHLTSLPGAIEHGGVHLPLGDLGQLTKAR